MRTYEGLFILNNAALEQGIQESIDKVAELIAETGGKVQTIQKMDKRNFARVANKKNQSGYYVNIIFDAGPDVVAKLNAKIALDDIIFRAIFTLAPAVKAEAANA